MPQQAQQEYLANLGVTTMSDLFQEMLLLSRADQLGIRAEESEIREMIEEQKQNYGITTNEEFQQALAASNMTLDDMRSNLERDIMLQKVVGQEIHARIKVQEEDLRRYYQSNADQFREEERLKLQEVVVLGSSGLKADDLILLANEIRQQVINGGTLEEVSRPYVEQGMSTSPVELGWVSVGDLDRDLEEAVWNLEKGEISEAIPGRGGLHVIQVVERQDATLKGFVDVKDQIEIRERARRLRDEMSKYAAELEKSAYIVANPPPEAAGFRASLQTEATASDSLSVALTAPLMTEPESSGDEATESTETPLAIPTGGPANQDSKPKTKQQDSGAEGLSIPTGAPSTIPTGGPDDESDPEDAAGDDDSSDDS
jgi:parvulin-like peptidyl-prolyl isomerase